MKLATFAIHSAAGTCTRVGVVTTAGIVDATAARCSLLEKSLPRSAAERIARAEVPAEMTAVLEMGRVAREWIEESVNRVVAMGIERTGTGQKTIHALGEIQLLAPIPRPPAMFNFNFWPGHRTATAKRGMSMQAPQAGVHLGSFWKGNPLSFVGPDAVLEIPSYATEIDVECEIAAIIGEGGKDLDEDQAKNVIAGYTIFNDVSVRSLQTAEMNQGRGMSKAKDFDTGNVMGPWIVTPDELDSPRDLRYSLHVNGEQWSSAMGEEMQGDLPEVIAFLSRGQTLLPGCIVATGAYAGGSGFDLGRTLAPGDTVELRISGIGSLVNRIGQQQAQCRPITLPDRK